MGEAKKDCFAYRTMCGTEVCTALKQLYCRYGKGECKFYKKEEEFCKGCPSKTKNPIECRLRCIPARKGKVIF